MENNILFESLASPLKLGSKSFDVFVLQNNQRVIAIKSIQKALGYEGKNENWLSEFLKDICIYLPIATTVLKAYQNPIQLAVGQKTNSSYTAVDIDVIKDTFLLIVKAKNEGFLNVNQIKFSKEAKLLVEDDNIDNIKKLVDQLTGFSLFKENTVDKMISNLKKIDLAFVWIKTFPDDFFELLMEMKNLNWKSILQNQQNYAAILNEIIFSRIDGLLLEELRVLKPKRSYQRKNSNKQDLQHPKLKQHLAILFSLAKVSGNNWNIFMQLVNKSFPEQKNKLSKNIKIFDASQTKPLSDFDQQLLKCMIFKAQ